MGQRKPVPCNGHLRVDGTKFICSNMILRPATKCRSCYLETRRVNQILRRKIKPKKEAPYRGPTLAQLEALIAKQYKNLPTWWDSSTAHMES